MLNKKIVLNYYLGNACNLRCKFCYNDTNREEKQYYEKLVAVKADLDKLVLKSNIILFIGGEPLLFPGILDIIKYSREIGFKGICIATNGIKFSDYEFTNKVMKLGVDKILFSFHANNSSLDNEISDRKNIFDKRMQGLENFQKVMKEGNYNTSYVLNLVTNSLNVPTLDSIIEFYYKKGFREINLYGMLQPLDLSPTNYNLVPKYSDIFDISKKFKTYNDLYIGVHWTPLCMSSKYENLNFIREVNRIYIYNINNKGDKLFDSQINHKNKLDECKKCSAYGKFCFGVYKSYGKKFGNKEFKRILEKDIINIIKNNFKKN